MTPKAVSDFTCAWMAITVLLAILELSPAANAGGVRALPIASLAYARTPIVVDGNLGDWPDVRPVTFIPLNPGLTKSGSASMIALNSLAIKPSIQVCYDAKAIYLGITWNGAAAAQAAGDIEVVASADRTARVRFVKGAGSEFTEEALSSDQAKWEAVAGGAAARAVRASVAIEEIRVPWALITANGAPPRQAITLALDFSWPALTTAFLKQIPPDVRHDNTHQTFCFLTSQEKLFTNAQYLGNPTDWGTLDFAGGEHANSTQESPCATGTTDMFVSRVANPIKVNGNLDKWPSARFQAATYLPAFLGKRYSANIATAYDSDNFYIAVRYNSANGPFNTKPEITQSGYAGGDCLQVRINNGKRTINLCAWYDGANKKPALTADGNDLTKPYLLAQGAQEAFVTSPDETSYTQELSIPWQALGLTAPAAGDTFKASFQFWWAGLQPQFTAIATATLDRPGGIPLAYTIPAESNVTVAVFDKQGHLLRNLAKDAHRRAGKNVEYWDGKDQFGQAVTPGEYVLKGLYHPPIDTQYVMSAVNPGTPPWPTSDGTGDWLSDEAAPQGAATDGRNVYLAAPGSEKGYAIIAVGPDGKRIWGYQEDSNPRCVSLAVYGKFLFALFSGPELTDSTNRFNGHNAIGRAYVICLNKDTGALASFSTQHPRLRVATWPYTDHTAGLWDLRKNKTFSAETYGGQTRYFANDMGEPTEALGIAAWGDKLYISLFNEGQILVIDSTSGKQLDSIDLLHPAGLHADADGRLIAVSDGKIVRLDPTARTSTPIIAHDLAAPHDVTTDSHGNLYVSDWGYSYQVKVFSPAGKLVRTIGKPGGRPWVGAWVASGMLLPRGLAVTSDGKLWVAEDDAAPSRVSVWNAETGALVHDYIGPTPYGGAGMAWLDPKDPTLLLGEGVFWRLDMAKKTWTPLSTAFRRMGMDEPFTPNAQFGPSSVRVIEHADKQYFYVAAGYNMTVLRRDGLRLTPVAAIGCRGRYITDQGSSESIWDSDIGTHYVANYFPEFFNGHKGENYVWVDTNGDGKVQPDEVQWAKTWTRGDKYAPDRLPEFLANWGWGVSQSGAIFAAGFCGNNNAIARLDPQRWTEGGVPVYDLASARVIHQDGAPSMPQAVYVTNTDKLIVSRSYEWDRQKTAIDAYTLDGAPLWSLAMPKSQQADDIESDQITGEIHTKGAGTILATWLWHGNYKSYLTTEDGLYISSLLDDTKLGPKANWDESFRSVHQAPDGKAYIINGANDTYHILQITGLDAIERFSSPVTVNAQDLEDIAQANQAEAARPAAAPKPIVHISWGATSPGAGITMHGSGNRSARVSLSRDAANLMATYEVHGSKLVNKGSNWQTLFITGDCADLMLSITPSSGKQHYVAAAGDERLLLSIYQGKPIAVLYRPVVQGAKTPVRFMAATIDQVVRLDSAVVTIQHTDDGYVLSATVPLKDIGLDPSRTDTLRGDVGVIYADDTGSNRSQRVYYYNQHTDIVSDMTTEATLQPGEWGDIELPMGPNLLKNGDFSQPFTAKPDDGWNVRAAENGVEVKLDDTVSYSGGRSLLIRQTQPVVFEDKAYLTSDYGAYLKSANGGKGGGRAEIVQNIPVTAGKSYHLRVHYLSHDLQPEVKEVKPGRGYAALMVWMYWLGNVKTNGAVWVANEQADPPDGWKTLMDNRFPYYSVSKPYTAPEGANGVQIAIYEGTNASGKLPVIHVDDIEFVEAN